MAVQAAPQIDVIYWTALWTKNVPRWMVCVRLRADFRFPVCFAFGLFLESSVHGVSAQMACNRL